VDRLHGVLPDNRIVLATDYALAGFTERRAATVAGLKTGDRITASTAGRDQLRHLQEIVSVGATVRWVFTVNGTAPYASERHPEARP